MCEKIIFFFENVTQHNHDRAVLYFSEPQFPQQADRWFIFCLGCHIQLIDEKILSVCRNPITKELINQLFGDGVSANGKNLFVDKLYVTTQTENEPTISLLRKLGFREVEDGPVMVVLGNIFEKEDNFFAHEVVKLVLNKENFLYGN